MLPDQMIGYDREFKAELMNQIKSYHDELNSNISTSKPIITNLLNEAWMGTEKEKFEMAINKVFTDLEQNFNSIFDNMKRDFENLALEWENKDNR